MKILVTGGQGYLGRYICESFRKIGDEVVSIDIESNISGNSGSIIADFSDINKIGPILRTADALIHTAAIPGVSAAFDNPQRCIDVNIQKLLALFQAVVQERPQIKIFFY